MDAAGKSEAAPLQGRTSIERKSECEVVVTRTFDAPARIVFEAWTRPELFQRWWAPKSIGVPLRSCDIDVRTGGKYRLEFGHDAAHSFAFFGKYLDVVPDARIVWTNDEGEEGSVTTVTFKEAGGRTLLVVSDLYPSKEALDEAMVSGSLGGFNEQFEQLDELLVTLDPKGGHS